MIAMAKDIELLNKILSKVNIGDEPLKNSYIELETDLQDDISKNKDNDVNARVRNDFESEYPGKDKAEDDKPFEARSIILQNSKYNPNMADVELKYMEDGMLALHMLGEREQNYYVTCKNMEGASWTDVDADFTEDYVEDKFDKAYGLIDMVNLLAPAITDYGEQPMEDIKVTLNGLNDRGLGSLSSNLPRVMGSIEQLYTSEEYPNDEGGFQLRLNIDSVDKKTFPQIVINVEPNDVEGSNFSQKATLLYNAGDRGRFTELIDELGKLYEVVDTGIKTKDMERELNDDIGF